MASAILNIFFREVFGIDLFYFKHHLPVMK